MEREEVQKYTTEERLRYALKRYADENRRLNSVLLNEERIQKEMEKRLEAEAELRIYKKKMEAALAEQQNQLAMQKRNIEAMKRKNTEHHIFNDLLYKAIKDAGVEFDFRAAREMAHMGSMKGEDE